MALRLNDAFLRSYVTEEEIRAITPEIRAAHEKVIHRSGKGSDFLGWYTLPESYDREEFARIQKAADYIRKNCQVLIVIGIGGSYLGARAAIEFVKSPMYNMLPRDHSPEIYFAGNTISAAALQETLTLCEGKDVCVNVISKSGRTTEPAIAFRVFRELLIERYGAEGAAQRIFVTTDKNGAKSTLKALADQEGYETFVVPDDVGGRYSVLTAVGLLPIAAAGIDIEAMMQGAAQAMHAYTDDDPMKNDSYRYAAIRNILNRKGKDIEMFAAYTPATVMLGEWWKQLFGESEGKDGVGIFPAAGNFSTDLHSMGQMIQQGKRNLFETVIQIVHPEAHVLLKDDAQNLDGLNYLSGSEKYRELDAVNQAAFLATVLAHSDPVSGQVPNIVLELDGRSAADFGYLVYFFELACAISGYVLGINPFDQPGVEGYKNNMYALLGNPSFCDKPQNAQFIASLRKKVQDAGIEL